MSVVLHKGEDCRFVPPPSAEPLTTPRAAAQAVWEHFHPKNENV